MYIGIILCWLQVRSDSATLDKGETLVFDSYQNSVGLALTRVLAKFNWVTLKTSAGGGERGTGMAAARGKGAKSQREVAMKNVQSLISLLSWQLATLWDTVQRVRVYICVDLFPGPSLPLHNSFTHNHITLYMTINSGTQKGNVTRHSTK